MINGWADANLSSPGFEHGQLPSVGKHIVPEDVDVPVSAEDFEVPVVRGEPAVEDLYDIDFPAAEKEPPGSLLAPVSGVAIHPDVLERPDIFLHYPPADHDLGKGPPSSIAQSLEGRELEQPVVPVPEARASASGNGSGHRLDHVHEKTVACEGELFAFGAEFERPVGIDPPG
jgi:hypothetical protein